ncbi:hypothetical protein [Mesorhizobium amorphae]|uniref:hypothetical protein n=1 Tax=Mesorhizobium amorphae TaxID=71433 RepID=UPI0002DC2808|nr:hypothetical protein [Mesorhizobium amorphae]
MLLSGVLGAGQRLSRVRDIWSFYGIWQDFGRNRSLYARLDHYRIRRGMTQIPCRNLLLTINVLHFLSIGADTPRAGASGVGRETGSSRRWSQLCRRRRMTTLSAGMMPFGKIEKSLHEGR